MARVGVLLKSRYLVRLVDDGELVCRGEPYRPSRAALLALLAEEAGAQVDLEALAFGAETLKLDGEAGADATAHAAPRALRLVVLVSSAAALRHLPLLEGVRQRAGLANRVL